MQLLPRQEPFSGFTYISRKTNPFRNRWHPKRELFAWGPDVQQNKSNKQPIRHPLAQENLRRVWSLEYTQLQTFVSRTAQTMGLGMFSFMFPEMAQHSQAWAIAACTASLPMKGTKPVRENWSVLWLNDGNKDHQFDYFVPDKAGGLSQAGQSRLN